MSIKFLGSVLAMCILNANKLADDQLKTQKASVVACHDLLFPNAPGYKLPFRCDSPITTICGDEGIMMTYWTPKNTQPLTVQEMSDGGYLENISSGVTTQTSEK